MLPGPPLHPRPRRHIWEGLGLGSPEGEAGARSRRLGGWSPSELDGPPGVTDAEARRGLAPGLAHRAPCGPAGRGGSSGGSSTGEQMAPTATPGSQTFPLVTLLICSQAPARKYSTKAPVPSVPDSGFRLCCKARREPRKAKVRPR